MLLLKISIYVPPKNISYSELHLNHTLGNAGSVYALTHYLCALVLALRKALTIGKEEETYLCYYLMTWRAKN